MSISNLLQPVIITYNRASHLRQTLIAFSESNLSDAIIHILDNASTDETPAVVKEMQARMPNLTYHRNAYNIGGNGNILRAVEIADSRYHWVIGDDDDWTLTPETLQELGTILQEDKADIVRLGWLVSSDTRGKLKPAREIIAKEKMFFASLSMVSATILRRRLVSQYLAQSYMNICDSYPQLVAPMLAIQHGPVAVYTLSKDLMLHTPSKGPGYFSGDFEWYAGWFRSSRFLTDAKLRESFVREVTYYMCREKPGLLHEQIWLTKVLLYYKSFGLNQWPYLLSMLAYGTGRRLSVTALLFTNLVTPKVVLSGLRQLYFKLNKLPPKTIQVDRSRL